MRFDSTTDLSSTIYKDALTIRKTVFVQEQHVDESLEIDDLEDKALHIVGYANNQACCTARLIEKENGLIKIQRVAVLKEFRNKGIGLLLLQEIERLAREFFEASKLLLDSQNHAIPFYEKSGFTVYGDGFLDANIPHHHMEKVL